MLDEAVMTEDPLSEAEPSSQALQAVHKQWALWTIRKFRFMHPELNMSLYGKDWKHTIYVANGDEESFAALTEFFHNNVRPVTCNISLSQQIPLEGVLVEEVDDYEGELWLNGEPLTVADGNNLLSLAEAALPRVKLTSTTTAIPGNSARLRP